ncbi:flagellar hook-basal body protein [Ramlibacter sp.]|uniref:flagellar hook-basal body protein n=1 Tax=Ramlibacter sp. TaxID=1917967 RepID=UPI003D099103
MTDTVLAIALKSLHHDMARLEQVAHNLGNVATPGYKRQALASGSFSRAFDSAGGPPPTPRIASDLRAGTLQITNQPLDLALTGDGFFEVMTPHGPAYTRSGRFAVDAQGRLATAEGHAVMGRDGEIRLEGRAPSIDAAGHVTEVRVEGAPPVSVGRIKVVGFERPQELTRLGSTLFGPDPRAGTASDAEVRMRQGALENANVNSAREMVELMQTMRHFEGMHRIVQGYDEMLGGAVRKLAEA